MATMFHPSLQQMQMDMPMDMSMDTVAAPLASSSGIKPKRKRAESFEMDEEEMKKHLRVLPPSIEGPGGLAFPLTMPTMPDLVPDSACTSEADRMDHDMDFEMDEPYVAAEEQYSYSMSGSGGFGFGPGADEDELDSDEDQGYPNLNIYPSLTAHPNPHHFSNKPPYTTFSSSSASAPVSPVSPWNAQPFATNLGPPTAPPAVASASSGLIQPAVAAPLGPDATAVDRARASHGPQCTSIPKLKMSDYPDPATGERSLWTVCQDCGACERAS